MQQNPASKTVKGVNIAALILSILCALSMILCMACTGAVQAYVDDHADEIADAIGQEINTGGSNLSVNVSVSDAAELQNLASALSATGNEELVRVANMLVDLSKGDVSSSFTFFMESDMQSMIDAKNAVANMTDADLQGIVDSTPGVELSSLKDLRSSAKEVSDDDIKLVYTFFNSTTNGEKVSMTSAAFVAMLEIAFGFILVLAILNIIASIIAIRNAGKPEKLGGAFVLAIISAVAAIICGGLVRCILYIISAVYISKVRRNPQVPPQYPSQNQGQYSPQYQQPVNYPGSLQ